jgi:hypothetical protein
MGNVMIGITVLNIAFNIGRMMQVSGTIVSRKVKLHLLKRKQQIAIQAQIEIKEKEQMRLLGEAAFFMAS